MRRTLLIACLVGVLAIVGWTSFHLAGIRIFQVDECQNVYVANLVASGHVKDSFTPISLLIPPLSWLSAGAGRSIDLFVSARFFSLEVFWLNLLLLTLATGERLFSFRGLIAFISAASLAPLWDYGFEIRHDNLLLTGLLATWCVIRFRPPALQSYFIAGLLAAVMEFVAFKAFVYTIPLTLAILVFPPPGKRPTRWKLTAAWLVGALLMCVVVRVVYGVMGIWESYISGFGWISAASTGGVRFGPWQTLARLFVQTPLLLGLVFAAIATVILHLKRLGKAALTWEGILPECVLFLGAFGILLISPAPYPYNLLHLVPYAFLLGFRYAVGLWKTIPDNRVLIPVAVATFLFTHFIPFWLATQRHYNWTNYRQERLMRLAEALTHPTEDPVYDGIGMVPLRRSIHFNWFLHSLNLQRFLDGSGPKVKDMLAAKPAAVIIPSYRTDWLTEEDQSFITNRYVPVANDFLVLGKVLPAGGGTFEIYHEGRYRISTLKGSDLADTYELGLKGIMVPEDPGTLNDATLDGQPFCNRPVRLCKGVHRIECAADCQSAIVWMGPHLDRIHRLGPGDHRALFVNWY